jgi:DNA-binding HxlR family transcriptional regulator
LSTIGTLEESRASLRLLIHLYKNGKPIMLTILREEMNRKYKIGRHMLDSAIEACIKLGLVERKIEQRAPMPILYQSLTPKGKKAAQICLELEKALT